MQYGTTAPQEASCTTSARAQNRRRHIVLECRQWQLVSQRHDPSGGINRLDIVDVVRGERLGHARPADVAGAEKGHHLWRWPLFSLWEFRETLDDSLVFVMRWHRWTRRATVADALSQRVGRVGYAGWCRTRGWITQDRHRWEWTIAATSEAWEFIPVTRPAMADSCLPTARVTIVDAQTVIMEAAHGDHDAPDPFTKMMWLAAAAGLALVAAPRRLSAATGRTREASARSRGTPPLHTGS